MAMACPLCDRPIGGDRLSLARKVAVCESCGELFDLAPRLEASEQQQALARVAGRFRIRRVAHPVEVAREADGGSPFRSMTITRPDVLTIDWPWVRRGPMPLALVNAGGWAWLAFAVSKLDLTALRGVAVALGLVAAGLVAGYLSLTAWLASYRLTLDGGELIIHNGPWWWRRHQRLALDDLGEIHVETIERDGEDGVSVRHVVIAHGAGGVEHRLVFGLAEDEARFLASVLEDGRSAIEAVTRRLPGGDR
jgi:hypothetical protein